MGSSFLEYQQAQQEAKNYVISKRKIQRNTFRYVVASTFGVFVTFLIAPKLVLPSILISVAAYGLVRFGWSAYTKARHWWLDKKAQRAMRHEGPKEEPLLTHNSRSELREIANGPLSEALMSKSYKIAHYEQKATFEDKEPLTYTDRKHQRALFQYRMLEHVKSATLKGDPNFLDDFSTDRAKRRSKKIEILEKIKSYLEQGNLSIALKHIDKAPDCECVLSGHHSEVFITDLQKWNTEDQLNVFLPVPSHLTPLEERNFLKNSLLPLILDMDKVTHKVHNRSEASPVGRRGNGLIQLKTYPITADYISKRIDKVKESCANWESNRPSSAV
jgi:hypothetical protein